MKDPNTHLAEEKAHEEVSLKDLVLNTRKWFAYICSKWLTILLFGVFFAIIGFMYASFSTAVYDAEINFVIEDEKTGGLGAASGIASQFGFEIGGSSNGAFSGDNLIELLKSRLMVQKTLLSVITVNGKKQSLADLYIDFNQLRKSWKLQDSLENINFYPVNKLTLKQDSLLGEFHKQLLIKSFSVDKLDKKLSIISVKLSSKNELFAKYFAENLVKIVSDYYIETKTKKESENVSILQHQTDSVRNQLNKAITGVAFSTDNTPNLNPALQILKIPSQRKQIDVQVNTAILTELVKNLEISQITLRKETPLIQIIDKPILPLDKTKPGKTKSTILGFASGLLLSILAYSLQLIYRKVMA